MQKTPGYVSAVIDGLAVLFDHAEVAVVQEADRPHVIARRGGFRLACDEVRVLPAGRVKLYRLPAALKGKRSPFHVYASVGDRIAFYCSAARFAALLEETSAA